MLSSRSIQLIFSSWDVIKNIPDFQIMFSNQLSEKLEDSTVAEWFSGPANPHHLVFVKMIDLVVHLLGPDLDVIVEELTSQGRRHHKYHSDMIGFFHVDSFAQIADAFIEILRAALQEQATNREENEVSEDSVLHPGQLEAVTKSWSEFFTMIRAIMKQGVKIEVRRHKKRAERHRQEVLAKQGAAELSRTSESSSSTERMSDTASETDDSCTPAPTSLTRGETAPLPTARGKSFSPGRAIGKSGSLLNLGNMKSAPNRTRSGIRAGLSLLGGSNHGSRTMSSKLAKLSAANKSSGLKKGIQSMGRLARSRGSMSRLTKR